MIRERERQTASGLLMIFVFLILMLISGMGVVSAVRADDAGVGVAWVFVLVLSPMLSDEYPHAGARGRLRGWLTELVNELGAQGVRASMIEQRYAPGEPLGCHAHPSLAAHVRFAGELAALLTRELGW